MTIAASLASELLHEARATRALLERAPEDSFSWRPHEKSMTLGALASHIAHLPKWTRLTVERDELDTAQPMPPNPEATDRDDLLEIFEASLADARDALDDVDDGSLARLWALRYGDTTMVEMPKAAVLRSFVLNHLVHHRGQLTVYLRLLDVPLPAVYGPSADDAGSFA
ncbi:MAG: DinB family protein [Acidobacteriota bacterium]